MESMENCLSLAAQDLAEARLAAKRAARAEAREIRMKELERQQKEIYQVQKKYYGLDTKWGDIEQWMEDSERYSHRSRRNASVSDEDERMSVGSRGSLRGNYNSDLGLPGCGTNSKAQPAAQNGSRTPLNDDSLYSGSRRYSACSSRGQPSEYSCYLGSGSRASSRTSSARASPVVEERPEKDFNDKGARTASSLSAATLASLGGTSSRRGSGDTSISVDTEASIREIKDISELKDQIEDVEGRYMQGLKEMKDSLAEVEEKYKKAMVSNAQLDNEKTNFMYQVDTLKDVLLELEEQLAETHRQYEEKSKEFEREKHSHRILQTQYNELKESLSQRDELLTEIRQLQQKQDCNTREISDLQETIEWKDKKIGALERQKEFFDCVRSERDELRDEVAVLKEELKRHGIVLSSDLSPNGGILDGPLHEALVESSTKVPDNSAPVSKTGVGPLGRASEVKMKSETAEEGQSVQSSKTAECTEDVGVQEAAKVQTKETSSLAEREEEAESSMGSAVALACVSADGQIESVTTSGEQVSKTDLLHNEDNINSSVKGLDAITGTKQVVNSSSEASQGHVEKTDTLQTQRDVETKGSMEKLQGVVEFERATCSVKESLSDDFQDAMEFSNGQNISSETELHNPDECIVYNEEPQVRPLLENPKEGCNVQGILQNLGRHLDMAFDAGNDNVDGPLDRASDVIKESSPQNFHPELEVSGVSAQQPSEGIAALQEEAAGTKEGENIPSEEPHERSVANTKVISSFGDNSMTVDGTINGQADRGLPLRGKGIEPDIVKSGTSEALGVHEAKAHVEEIDGEAKTHSDEGEFYECTSEGSSPNGPVPEPILGEEPLDGMQHQEGSKTSSNVSSPETLEDMGTNTNEQITEKIRDNPSQLLHMPNPDIQVCNAKVDDEENIDKQGVGQDGTITSQEHDHQEADIDKTVRQHDLGENDQGGETQYDENSENVDPSSLAAKEFAKGSAGEELRDDTTQVSVTETPMQALPKLQNKGVLTEGNNDSHEEGLSPEATEQETEVSALPPSKEMFNIELQPDLEPSTQSPGMENTFVEPSDPLGFCESPGYRKEDTLDRNNKQGKGKNKEDCMLS